MKRLYAHNRYLTCLLLGIVFLCSFLGIPQTVYAAMPSIDSVSQGPVGNNSISWQHIVGNNSNRFLFIFVQTSGQNVSSVKLDGVTLSSAGTINEVTVGISYYNVFNPSVGTHTITVSGGSGLMGGAVSAYNVNQTNPWDPPTPSLTGSCIPSGAQFCFGSYGPTHDTNLWFEVFALDDVATLTINPMATGTRMWTIHSGTKYFAAEFLPGVNGTINPSWNVSPQPPNGSNVAYALTWLHVADVIPTATPMPTPTPTPNPTPTPTPVTYSISGNVFNDLNKNGLKESGESNYSGTPTITASRGIVTTQANGSYTISNLTAGTVTVSYNALPTGYSLTYPLNGPPPSYQVTVGPSCTVNGAVGAGCQ